MNDVELFTGFQQTSVIRGESEELRMFAFDKLKSNQTR